MTSNILLIARQTTPRFSPERFGLSMSGHRSEVICSGGLFSCLHTGQDSSGKKSNAFEIAGIQIPIRVTGLPIICFSVALQSVQLLVAHDCNRIGEFLSWVTNLLSRTTK
ncbi:hypothetical protein [Phyllobacterium calauticae]|uniref:hypothetical protein n=1 Tax=Phyllobacterium calauticae TaxID=2817027 RepID=UPI001CBB9018|nr:hypothetical protein [Phyllobacterium calauticae]MBZ3691013.1 hypothetical protein [Phyllobacterium calauticae]